MYLKQFFWRTVVKTHESGVQNKCRGVALTMGGGGTVTESTVLGLMTGVTPRAVSLIENLINLKERKDSSQELKKQLSNLANMIMNSECEDDLILDLRANNGARRKHDEYFDLVNEYI
jgi:hypothetical protein